MIPSDLVAGWRREIEAEARNNATQLAEAAEALGRAEAAHTAAVSAWSALQKFVTKGLSQNEGLAGALHSRLQGARESVTQCEGARGAARAKLKQLQATGAELRDALSQASRILEADRVVAFNPHAPPPRPQAPIVPFDNIEART